MPCVTKLLEAAPEMMHVKDAVGLTPIDVARKTGKHDVVALLQGAQLGPPRDDADASRG